MMSNETTIKLTSNETTELILNETLTTKPTSISDLLNISTTESFIVNNDGTETLIYILILCIIVLALFVIAIYFLYLYFKSSKRRFHSRFFSSTRNQMNIKEDSIRSSVEDNQMTISNQQTPYHLKEPNLQPAASELNVHDEFRTIIANKLKPPPSTLEGLIENRDNGPVDVEIKQELDNDDVFSVISTKSIEKYKTSRSKPIDNLDKSKDKTKLSFENSDTTESETFDKVIVLKSGSFNRSSRLGRKSKNKFSKLNLKKLG